MSAPYPTKSEERYVRAKARNDKPAAARAISLQRTTKKLTFSKSKVDIVNVVAAECMGDGATVGVSHYVSHFCFRAPEIHQRIVLEEGEADR